MRCRCQGMSLPVGRFSRFHDCAFFSFFWWQLWKMKYSNQIQAKWTFDERCILNALRFFFFFFFVFIFNCWLNYRLFTNSPLRNGILVFDTGSQNGGIQTSESSFVTTIHIQAINFECVVRWKWFFYPVYHKNAPSQKKQLEPREKNVPQQSINCCETHAHTLAQSQAHMVPHLLHDICCIVLISIPLKRTHMHTWFFFPRYPSCGYDCLSPRANEREKKGSTKTKSKRFKFYMV